MLFPGLKFLVDMRADILDAQRSSPAGAGPLRALSETLRQVEESPVPDLCAIARQQEAEHGAWLQEPLGTVVQCRPLTPAPDLMAHFTRGFARKGTQVVFPLNS